MDYGKFTSAEELLKGYNALEKSFTQKCQQLSTLQKQLGTSQTQTDQTEQVLPPVSADDVVATIPEVDTSSNDLVPTDEQLQQYLESNPQLAFKLLQAQVPTPTAPTVMTGGGTMSLALPSRPKTIKEATLMAQKLFE
ncbi:MAG: hypothetical protein IJB95_00465 [Clostridia bacterium]|nr:hypothetical protein [Clostridia bacterium]MBQ4272115.1 hypothetical protein [Clostridia bacterium]